MEGRDSMNIELTEHDVRMLLLQLEYASEQISTDKSTAYDEGFSTSSGTYLRLEMAQSINRELTRVLKKNLEGNK